MRESFNHTALLTELYLPSYLKEALWKTKVVNCKPAMDILSKASQFYLQSSDKHSEAHKFVDEIIQSVEMAHTYRYEFFTHKNGQIPDDVMYSIAGRPIVELFPEEFPQLSDNYHHLTDRVKTIHDEPDLYLSSRMDGAAKYAFIIEKFIQLKQFRHSVQSSIHTAGNELNKLYNSTVLPVKKIMKGSGTLTRHMQLAGRDIDFIVNRVNEERFWYIQYASRNFEKISDKTFIYDDGGMPDTPKLRSSFYDAYQRIEDRHDGHGVEAFYELAEKVVCTMNLLVGSMNVIQETEILYAVTRLSTDCGSDQETILNALALHPVSDDFMNQVELCRHLGEFRHKTSRFWGDKVNPFMFLEELDEFPEELRKLDHLDIRSPTLYSHFLTCRDQAQTYYNSTVKRHEVRGFEEYRSIDNIHVPGNDF